MVFPGRFSTGCLRCRQRKVKCDETKPSCKRCQIYGKPCSGYTDQFHFRTTLTKSSFERRTSGSSDSTTASSSSTNFIAFTGPKPTKKATKAAKAKNAAASPKRPPVIRPPQGIMAALEPSYEQTSLCYFVRRFISPYGNDGFPGHLSFLPALYNHAEQGLLETATLSVAQMAAYNRFGGEKFREQSYANYGRTIKMMQETIRSEDDAADDRVLASILLLCTLKDISGEGSGDPNEHAPGLFYLLEKRGLAQIATSRGIELFLLGVIRLQVYSFLHEDDTYSDPGSIASVLGLFNPLIRAMSMMCRVLRLRHRLRRYMHLHLNFGFSSEHGQSPGSRDPSDGAKECMRVLKECFAVLDDFDVWDSEVTSYWENTFEGRTLPPTALGAVASQAEYNFYDAETACTICLIRSARLILLMAMLQYHGAVQLASNEGYSIGNDAAWADCVAVLEQDVRKIIADILACVPYALGDLDPHGSPTSTQHDGAGAIVIVNTIRLVAFCAYATDEQVARAKEILFRMNVVIGIRSAEPWKGFDKEGLGKKWADEQAFLREMSHAGSPGPATDDSDASPSQQYTPSPTTVNFEYVF